MKNFVKTVASAIILSVFVFGCQKEEKLIAAKDNVAKDNASLSEPITIVDGIMKFETKEDFLKTTVLLGKNGGNTEEMDKWESQFESKRYVSSRKAFNAITKSDYEAMSKVGAIAPKFSKIINIVEKNDEKEVVRVIDSDILSTLVNKDGKMLIGDNLLEFEYTQYFTTKDYSKLSASNTIPERERKSITRKTTMVNARSIAGYFAVSQYVMNGDDNRRLCGEISCNNVNGLFTDVVIRTRHQNRAAWIWWPDQVPALAVSGTGFGQATLSRGNSCGNCSSVNASFPTFGDFANLALYNYVNASHTGTCADGQFRAVQTNI